MCIYLNAVKHAFALKHIKGKIIAITDSLDTIIDADDLLKHALADRNIGEYYLKISIEDSQDIPRKILSQVRHHTLSPRIGFIFH